MYTFKVAFSGLVGDIVQGTVEDVIPSHIQYTLPPMTGSLVDIEENPVEGGTQLVFVFGSVSPGNTIEFTLGAYFGEGRQDGDTFTNTAILKQEGEKDVSVSAEMVTLSLVGNFYMSKYSYDVGNPDVGESFPYRICLRNQGDLGATLNNVVITDTLPSGLVPVTSVVPTGMDTSETYPDTTYDGLTATWEGSSFTFTLPSFHGEEYTIEFQVQVDLRVAAGTTLVNSAEWWVAGVSQGVVTSSVVTYEDKGELTASITGGDYGFVGGEAQYVVYQRNSGTVALTDFQMVLTMPEEFDSTKIRVTSSEWTMATYSLSITSSADPSQLILVAEDVSGDSLVYDLQDYLGEGERVETIVWTSDEIQADNSNSSLYLLGTVSDTATVDSVLTLTGEATVDSSLGAKEYSISKSTILNNRSVLMISKSFLEGITIFNPLNEFTIALDAKAENGNVVTPIFADLLPTDLSYVEDSQYYRYYDAFTGVVYDSREDEFPLTLPKVEVMEDYEGTGRTLLRFVFEETTLLYQNELWVYFDTVVHLDANTSFTNVAYLGNPSEDAMVYGSSYEDILDLDGDGYVSEFIAQSNSIEGTVLYISAFSVEKEVQGNLDLDYSQTGSGTAGGEVLYQLRVTNNQESVITTLDVVDILPYVGDTGVILVDESRGSGFSVTLSQEVTAKIVNIITGEEQEKPQITVYYSTSTDPERFDSTGAIIGTGTWQEELPEDISTVASIRVTCASEILSYERLEITVVAVSPVDVPMGEIAYNSFAVQGTVTNGEISSTLLPTEPNKVSLTLVEDGKGSIGNFVWYDENQDGIYEEGEEGINGVTVMLYSGEGDYLATTVTADSFDGGAGYYLFSDLEAGEYQLEFLPLDGYQLTQQQEAETNGSKPDPSSGFTSVITLGEGESITDMIAGVYEKDVREQAITDVITSIALGETAIQGILDAEGAKIQKAVALGLTTAELLEVNASVQSMVEALTNLERVLVGKLTLVVDG